MAEIPDFFGLCIELRLIKLKSLFVFGPKLILSYFIDQIVKCAKFDPQAKKFRTFCHHYFFLYNPTIWCLIEYDRSVPI
jgi:hypothetical protein